MGGLLGNNRSNENSSNSCNGSPLWTPLTTPVGGSGGQVGNYRLHCNNQWKPKSEGFGHACRTLNMEKEPTLQMGSDKMIPRHVYDKPLRIRFPDRS
jgi:hypothetical protein